jgi:hypothetical protein
MNINFKPLLIVCSSIFLLSACGGGGDDTVSVPSPTSGPLAKYAGTYSFCDGNEKAQITVSEVNSTTISIVSKSDYYSNTNCQGTIVGTETYSAPVQAVYISNSQARVVDWPTFGTSSTQSVDRVTFSSAARTASVTGANVTTSGKDRCISYSGGSTCIDTSPDAAFTLVGGLAFTNTAILLLTATPSGYDREDAYPR